MAATPRTREGERPPAGGVRDAAAWRVVARLPDSYDVNSWWPLHPEWHRIRGTEPLLEVFWGAVLAQATSWRNVEPALAGLRDRHLVTPARILEAQAETLRSAVRPAGFFRAKSERLRAVAAWLSRKGARDGRRGCLTALSQRARRAPEAVREELLAIPGVGPETADSMLLYGLRAPAFIVDAYTRRLLVRLGHRDLGTAEAWQAEATRRVGGRMGPARKAAHFAALHAAVVEHCKAYCRAVPSCATCPLLNRCAEGRRRTGTPPAPPPAGRRARREDRPPRDPQAAKRGPWAPLAPP